MAIELEDWELTTLSNPAAFYDAVVSAKGYAPKPAIAKGDCEFFVSDLAIKNCIVACTLVHAKKEAYLVLLAMDDTRALQERLTEAQVSLSTSRLLHADRAER